MADERRKSILTEDDVTRIQGAIEETFTEQLNRWAETIGYDMSSQESRSEIRDDHRFVRSARKGLLWVIATVFIAVASVVAAAVVGQ